MRIAVLGLGFMGSTHIKAMRALPNVTLSAVCSNDPRVLSGDLSGIQGNLGGPGEILDFTGVSKYTEIDRLFADKNVDTVDICLPTHLHVPVAMKALQAGKHVLLEKPVAVLIKPIEQCLGLLAHVSVTALVRACLAQGFVLFLQLALIGVKVDTAMRRPTQSGM